MPINQDQFRSWHEQNPHVYAVFCQTTLDAIEKGFTRLSADFILHVMRWEKRVEEKLNNNWSAHYSRMFVKDHPNHRGVFETRRSLADMVSGDGNQLDMFG